MASWNELRDFITSNYKIMEDKGDILGMLFDLGGGRSQTVVIGLGANSSTGEQWVQISSAIGSLQEVNLQAACSAAFDWLCGGIVVIGDLVYLHHAAPLANLDTNEFVRPLTVVVQGADALEQRLTGSDRR